MTELHINSFSIRAIRHPNTLEAPKDFIDDINRWTLESVSVVALDKQLGLLKKNSEKNDNVMLLFKSLDEFFTYAAVLEVQPSLWRYIHTPMMKKLLKAFDNIQKVTLEYVNEAMERLDSEAKRGIVKPQSEQSVLEKLLKIDKKVATVMAMDMLMAGVDTVSHSSSVPRNIHFQMHSYGRLQVPSLRQCWQLLSTPRSRRFYARKCVVCYPKRIPNSLRLL